MQRESVYQRVLGATFGDLDPGLHLYFSRPPAGTVGIGRGIYDIAGSRHRLLRPLLAWTAWRRILFPESGRDVPFSIRNTTAADGTLRATRTFRFDRRDRTMCDAMTVVDGVLVDRLGRRGGLQAVFCATVVDGGLRLTSERLHLRLGACRVPLPRIAVVTVDERAGVDGQYVDVQVRSPILGEWFRYAGSFTYDVVPESTTSSS